MNFHLKGGSRQGPTKQSRAIPAEGSHREGSLAHPRTAFASKFRLKLQWWSCLTASMVVSRSFLDSSSASFAWYLVREGMSLGADSLLTRSSSVARLQRRFHVLARPQPTVAVFVGTPPPRVATKAVAGSERQQQQQQQQWWRLAAITLLQFAQALCSLGGKQLHRAFQ